MGRTWEYRDRSQRHECGNWDWGRVIPRKGIHKWDFRCSVLLTALPTYCLSLIFGPFLNFTETIFQYFFFAKKETFSYRSKFGSKIVRPMWLFLYDVYGERTSLKFQLDLTHFYTLGRSYEGSVFSNE